MNSNTQNAATRTLLAGETLLRQGERIDQVYVVQSGRLLLLQTRGSQLIEVGQVTAPQCFGDEATFGPAPRCSVTVIAACKTTVMEVPAMAIREQLKTCSNELRELGRGLHERTKMIFANLRTMRGDRGAVCCPPDETAKIFAVLFHSVRIAGNAGAGAQATESASADWQEVRRFASEIFGENLPRLETAAQILLRLEIARMEPGPNGTEKITILGMKQVEEFFEFYGTYHFKSGYENLLKTNLKMTQVTEAFLKTIRAPGSGLQIDRAGVARVPYKSTIDAMKKILPGFEADQLFRLEQKGLFIKRQSTNDGGSLSFLPQDFEQMLRNWRILKEVETWNEKGYVEPSTKSGMPEELSPASPDSSQALAEKREREHWARTLANWKPQASVAGQTPRIRTGGKKLGEAWCPVCMSVCKPRQKTCEVCGADLQTKAA